MLIFLYGSDSYRRQKKIKEIIGEYRRRHPNLIFERFNPGISDEFSRLLEFASSRSMFENIKLSVIEGAFSIDGIKNFLESNLKTEDLILVISEDSEPPEDLKFLKNKPVLSQKFSALEGERLIFFIKNEIKRRGFVLTPQAAEFLAENFNGDTWGLMTEIEKLSLVDRKFLDIKDLREFGDFCESPDIFRFINLFIRSGGIRRKITELESLFLSRQEPAKIFNFLASMSRSPQLVNRLADYDVAVKSGKSDYEEVLLDLALN